MKRLLRIKKDLDNDGGIDLTDDRPSGRLFWGTLLDFADTEKVSEITYQPSSGDNCISIVTGGEALAMVPPPCEVRPLFLRYAQEIALGRVRYFIFRWLGERAFPLQRESFLVVDVDGRRSEWKAHCAHDSIHFQRVTNSLIAIPMP